jgi:hypothetical protein
MAAKIVPSDDTIDELQRRAEEFEHQAHHESEPVAGELRLKARLLWEWIRVLRTGKWTS